jgi:hypothetical protein
MDSYDALDLIEEHRARQKTRGELATDALAWFLDEDNVGAFYTRAAVIRKLATELDVGADQANQAITDTVGDIVDPVQQIPGDDAKYIGVIDYQTFPAVGAYGYVDYDDKKGSRNRVVCARCVETEESDENISHATQGTGTSSLDADWEELLERIDSHYTSDHDEKPTEITPGASLLSGTTISGNTTFHAGNDGIGSGLDADTLNGSTLSAITPIEILSVSTEADLPAVNPPQIAFVQDENSYRQSVGEDGFIVEDNTVVQSIQTQFGNTRAIEFNDDGTKLFEAGFDSQSSSQRIATSTLSTPFDISTATFQQSNPSQSDRIQDIVFNNDGTKLFELDSDREEFLELSLSTPFDVSTATLQQTVQTEDSRPEAMEFNDDGTKLFELGVGEIYQHPLSTAFDFSTLSTNTGPINRFFATFDTRGFTFSANGRKIFGITRGNISVGELPTPFDIGTIKFLTEGMEINDFDGRSLRFSNDGKKLFLVAPALEQIQEYSTLKPPRFKVL